MKLRRVLAIREILLVGTLLCAFYGGYAAYGQSRYQPPTGVNFDRMQDQLDGMEKDARADQREAARQVAEVRQELAVLRSELSVVTRIGWGMLTAISGLIVQALWGVIAAKRSQN